MESPAVLPISLKPSNLRPLAYRVLSKKHGLNIQSSALEKLSEYVGKRFGQEWRGAKTIAFLEEVARLWKEQNKGLFLDGDNIDVVIKEISLKQEKQEKASRQSSAIEPKTNLAGLVTNELRESQSFEVHQDPLEPAALEQVQWKDFFKAVDIKNYRRYRYNHVRKQFDVLSADAGGDKLVLPSTQDAVNLFTQRFHLLKDRLLRNENFQPTTFSAVNSFTSNGPKEVENQQVTSIKNLLGRHGQRFFLFGLLTRSALGLWQLQDDTDSIELDLGQTLFPQNCYFTEGNFIICEGIYSNSGKFYVSTMIHPPAEKRETSLEVLGKMDFNSVYSNSGRIDPVLRSKLLHLEKDLADHKFIFLGGDIYLSDAKVMEGLKKLLAKLNEELETGSSTPVALIFNGSFTSRPFTSTQVSYNSQVTSSGEYKSYFDSLASILEPFSELCATCKFVFVPGDNDPWSSVVTKGSNSVWPKFRLPKIFGNRLTRLVKDIEWCSNPSKLTYLTHEVLLVRDDLAGRFRRNDISHIFKIKENIEADEGELEIDKLSKSKIAPDVLEARKVVKTLLDQGYLSPFIQSIRPLVANYANMLNLIPLPTLLMLADTTCPRFDLIYENCHVLNPGKFFDNNKFNYMEYSPSSRKAKLRELY
ncbi:hypothetical protein KL938_004138 [Ogataea parapolymorpha]|nr:hypothetical protein KL938_004138 [Ogataea parapolymorpha]